MTGRAEYSDMQLQLVRALQGPDCYPHPVKSIRHLETHISHLLLTGQFAYKIKKPVDLGFLDFSTLEKRRFYCEEEVRLNRRLAPADYLDVVTINGSIERPQVAGSGPVLDYAVKMRQFDPESTLDRVDGRAQLTAPQVDAIAAALADFHGKAAVAPADSDWGTADAVWAPAQQNFTQIASRIEDEEATFLLESIRTWSQEEYGRLGDELERRRKQGFIRECHGDLHLGNMAWREGDLLIFDCLEFNPALRWIDVMSEAAFCYMDLLQRGHRDFAARFINHYLERTGDYAGTDLLRFYAVYRAMVRAKVACIRAHQSGQTVADAHSETAAGLAYLRFATSLTQSEQPRLIITHGLSGSGKTAFSSVLLEKMGAIRLRSDVERKRLAGLDALARTNAEVEKGIYGRDFSRRTYGHLAYLAERLLHAGWTILVDATFIACWQRDTLYHVASACGVSFHILDFPAPADLLRERVIARGRAGGDASEADLPVLESQLLNQEPLTAEESAVAIAASSVEDVVRLLD
jgi:uncharacterized protein